LKDGRRSDHLRGGTCHEGVVRPHRTIATEIGIAGFECRPNTYSIDRRILDPDTVPCATSCLRLSWMRDSARGFFTIRFGGTENCGGIFETGVSSRLCRSQPAWFLTVGSASCVSSSSATSAARSSSSGRANRGASPRELVRARDGSSSATRRSVRYTHRSTAREYRGCVAR
jgi:hypothetical protein